MNTWERLLTIIGIYTLFHIGFNIAGYHLGSIQIALYASLCLLSIAMGKIINFLKVKPVSSVLAIFAYIGAAINGFMAIWYSLSLYLPEFINTLIIHAYIDLLAGITAAEILLLIGSYCAMARSHYRSSNDLFDHIRS